MTYDFLIYDVWGNEEDGWDVNDVFRSGITVTVPEGASNDDIVALVYEADVAPKVEIDPAYDADSLYLRVKSNQRPLGELRPVR